ncbi:putative SLC9B1-like protein SLC9B1P1 isoform X3 [Sitodiplosis mosellana]|uniref:putative SLC9B1-like protein SLC9B1P1 isoform X3 n=1 Tax=Sitodiplosis mosellana TaxID=263140 RepID=UPI0024442449|nr:putative SLC9B1-like protein SLC9B1P1 isoform X3 [Sitodiplosis mosellana]
MSISDLVPSVNLELSQRTQAPAEDEQKLEYKGPKCWRYLVRYWSEISQPLALLGIGLIIWTLGKILLPAYITLDSAPTRMAVLFIGGQIFGIVLRLLNWPEMLGMIGFGMLFANVGYANFDGYTELEAFFRDLALVNIMLLAGMGIDLKALVQKLWPVLRLSVLPTVGEVLIIAVIAKYVLLMPFIWSFLLGLIITAVSPNVVIDIVLWLKIEKLGLYKGIHTIIIAVTTINDVLSIFCFNVVLGVIFSTGSLHQQLLQGPVGIAIGFVFGFVFGIAVSKVLPSEKSKYANSLRFMLMVLGGLLSVIGSRAIGFTSAGALGCCTLAAACGRSWKKPKHIRNVDVLDKLNLLWKFVKPISFALIGKEVLFSKLDAQVVGFGVLIVIIGSLCRLLLSYALTYGADLNWKERLYITISGFPKATVQAALAPIALDMVRLKNLTEYQHMASIVLIVSVLAIVLTAPSGAILMVKLAPKFLLKEPTVG